MWLLLVSLVQAEELCRWNDVSEVVYDDGEGVARSVATARRFYEQACFDAEGCETGSQRLWREDVTPYSEITYGDSPIEVYFDESGKPRE